MVLRDMKSYHTTFFNLLLRWQQQHPYRFSFVIALILLVWILLYTASVDVADDNYAAVQDIQFVDLDRIQSVRRVARKEIDLSDNADESNADVDRAVGTDDNADPVDIQFVKSYVTPRVTRIKKFYPAYARKNNIEADVFVQITIMSNGRVKNVNILRVRIKKELPKELKEKLRREFIRSAQKSLLSAQFSQPIVEGKIRPMIMVQPYNFRLEE